MSDRTTIEILRLAPALTTPLADLFADIQRAGDAALFHPHPFTADEAARLCAYTGRDLYFAARYGDTILGYGMLRGWDAGYATPSLGILVRASARGKGIGRLLMHHLHAAARLHGAAQIRLKVYRDNVVARQLYEGFGYHFDNSEENQLIGMYTFQ